METNNCMLCGLEFDVANPPFIIPNYVFKIDSPILVCQKCDILIFLLYSAFKRNPVECWRWLEKAERKSIYR